MKILEIIPDLKSRGGAEVFFDSLVMELSGKPDVEVVVVLIWGLIDESFKHLMSKSNIKYYCCGKTKSGPSFKSARKLKEILAKEKPDIIHSHRSVLLTYFLAFGFKKQSWKFYHTVHNVADKEAGKYEIILRKKYLKRGLINQIGISDLVSKSIEQTFKEKPVATIYNGIKLFSPLGEIKKKYDLICIARFDKQKNHIFLLETFKKYVQKHNDASLVLVGDGALLDECQTYVENNDLSNNVIFKGKVNNVQTLLCESRCFVLGSLYEGNPISILEAMNCGLPIVAPIVGGIPDVIEHEVNGFLYHVSNSDELLSSLEKVLNSKDVVENISRCNVEKIKKYSIEECADNYYQLFKLSA